MKRRRLRIFLVVGLVFSALFAAWSWFRPYEWGVDERAGCRLRASQVKKDREYYWVDLHLILDQGKQHDLMSPVRLETASGKLHEPADTTLGGSKETGTTDLWFKFWLEADDFSGPMKLKINDGELSVRTRSGEPQLGSSGYEVFVTNHW